MRTRADAYDFRDRLLHGAIPCALLGTAPPLDILELCGPCWTRTSMRDPDASPITDTTSHDLFYVGLDCAK